jgi:ankyrin repeat protein
MPEVLNMSKEKSLDEAPQAHQRHPHAKREGNPHKLRESPFHLQLSRRLNEMDDVDETDELFCTPLHYAVSRGLFETTVLLIRKGADVNAKNRFNETPIVLAARAGFEGLVNLLLRSGADPGVPGESGLDALGTAKAEMFGCRPERRTALAKVCNLLASQKRPQAA